MPNTSKGLRYPSSSAAPNVSQDIQNLASDVDSRLTVTLGHGYLTAQTTITSATWQDLVTVTATSTGGPCIATISETAFNGNSGSDRTMDVRVICDGVALASSNLTGILMPLANLQPISRNAILSSTPVAGSHTWKLQVQASAVSAVVVQTAMMRVEEKP